MGVTSTALRELQPAAPSPLIAQCPPVTRVTWLAHGCGEAQRVCLVSSSLYLPQRHRKEEEGTPCGPVLRGSSQQCGCGEKQAGHHPPQDRGWD